MNKQHQTKYRWQILGVIAVFLGAIATPEAATATPPQIQDGFKLAQVGVRSRINGPTPLNISPPPGTHTPLPSSNYHRSGYYGYPSRDYVNYRHYDRYKHDRYHNHRRRDRGVNIIINLPTHRRSYYRSNTYIRIGQ